jgi:hypothetical protein
MRSDLAYFFDRSGSAHLEVIVKSNNIAMTTRNTFQDCDLIADLIDLNVRWMNGDSKEKEKG